MSAVSRMAVTTTTAMAITARPSMRPTRSTSRWSGVALVLGALEQGRDPAHLGGHPGGGDQCAPVPAGDGRAVEHHVRPIAEGDRPGQGGEVLEDSLALASEGRLRHHERGGGRQAGVGAHRITLRQQQDITRDEVAGGDPLLLTVPEHPGARSGHRLERGDGVLGAGLLHVAQHRVQHDDGDDDQGLEGHPLGPLDQPGDEGDHHRAEEEVDQGVGELGQDLAPPGDGRGRVEAVGPEPGPAFGHRRGDRARRRGRRRACR